MIVSVSGEISVIVPESLVAVTTTRSREPASVALIRRVVFVAPLIATQPAPVALQRCHWSFSLIGASPDQLPWLAVSVRPGIGLPKIAGSTVAVGANFGLGSVGKVWFVISVSDPTGFVAVMYAR